MGNLMGMEPTILKMKVMEIGILVISVRVL